MKKMTRIMSSVLLASAMLLLAACGNGGAKDKLVISTWGLGEDVLWADVYEPFEEQYNVEIVLETGTTPERYTKLESNPNSEVDVIELSQKAAADGYAAGLFETPDYTNIPNTQDLIPSAQKIIKDGSGTPYVINSIGIIYDQAAVGFEIKEWADLWKPELKGKISIPDITSTFGPAIVHIANDYKGGDLKADKGAAAFEGLKELHPNVVKTYTKSADLANMFSSGEITVAIVGDFGYPMIKDAHDAVEYMVPKTGTYANFNTIEINKNSKNKELAYKYIDWRISQEVQKNGAGTLNEAPVNATVELTPEEQANKTVGEIAETAKVIDYTFVNPLMDDWIDQWNRIMNQ